ncbi:hypothetical protein [Streptomyces sp. DSM 40907]|uniref:hypothetical protein n=1 Tax=Streptomyces kutzneri TaxID=3051179 RepID=UPI0028D1231B|nr:hypothetical protein [Streptomyces sp. DSM 40907]
MPDHPTDASADGESSASPWLWSLLGLFAACVPCALLVVEKSGSALPPVPLTLAILAALAGYVVAVRVVVAEKFAQCSRRSRILVWLAAAGLFLGSVAVLFAFRPPPPPLPRMSGVRDVAVVGFAGYNGHQDKRVLADVAAEFAHAMAGRLSSATAVRSYAGEASLPLADLQDTHRSGLERKTARFADETNAEIVVGGLVSTDPSGQTTLRPAVFVRADQIPDAPELTGWFLGRPLLIPSGWESAQSRARLTAELTRLVSTLAKFVDALDTWRTGSPAKAARILQGLLDPKQEGGSGSFVPPDLIRLFHGHAAEVQAGGETGPNRQKLLEAARADYRAISRDSPAGRRAELSLQFNAYLRALGPAHDCKPGTVRAGELAQVAQAFRALAKDREFTELQRLKATVNLAQAESCRITAKLLRDDGRVERAVAAVRPAPDITGSVELHALAESIGAVHAAGQGDLAAAIRHIRVAVTYGRDPGQRATWHGLLARWSLDRCDLRTGRAAQQDALIQLAAAEQAGRASTERIRQYEQLFDEELRQAEKRCGTAR